ncbi:DUF4019 domain-containing protein [Collimonas silvisoli]|uniref:DUF4019 domain-containing protein n=1 Tax=Collimonas silvisoli TaxID=2825884 RepID=UPI001B8B4F9A|nr:DUF4019 domain-containing protein [Collimonas silvisoli]
MSLSFRQIKYVGAFVFGLISGGSNAYAQSSDTSVDAALNTATQWVAMADANQAVHMWSLSSPEMKKKINQEEWGKYLNTLQKELGHINGRDWVQISHFINPSNSPPGEYMSITFSSRFSNTPALERVSLIKAAYRWVPIGYVITKKPIESAPNISSGK